MGKYPRTSNASKASNNFAKALMCLAVMMITFVSFSNSANAQTKSLKLYYLHTGEKVTIAFKKNGKYIQSGLKKINWALRDWRRNEPTKMDPKLLDLIWEVYRKSGSKKYIHVISGYRSPASNNLLRKRGRGVAKNSQHTKGNAMDFFLPDVKLKKLREIGLKMEVGGVGYYPTSGSPFVHMDTGNVRHWPRMSRKQLVKVFPNGKTMHIPTDGKPLARYEQAVASYKKRKSRGTLVPEPKIAKKSRNLFKTAATYTKDDSAVEDGRDGGVGVAALPRAVKTTRKIATPAPKPAVAVAPAPSPQAPVEPPVAPAEAIIATRETDPFAFPANIPVPVMAPRAQPEPVQEVVVAALEPEANIEPTSDSLVQAAEELLSVEQSPADEGTQLASLNLPVPAQRPDFGAVLANSDNAPNEQPSQTTEIAMLETPKTRPSEGQQVASLSPKEIEDLRSQVLATIPAANTPKPEPIKQQTVASAPIPAADLTNVPQKNQENADAPVIANAETNQDRLLPETPAEITVAALEPQPVEPTEATIAVPIPQPNPIVTASIEPEQQPIETVGIEPGVKTTGEISIPTKNPVAPVLVASLEPRTVEPVNPLLANLPIPTPNPRAPILMASLETEAVETPTITENVPKPQLASRTISLDKYSAPQNNTSTIGQWALSNETTIRDLAEVHAPAYGRNAIRQLSGTILVQSFNAQPFGPGQNNFKGKAVTAMNFARLQLNQ